MVSNGPRDEFVRLNDLSLHYRDWGDPTATTLLLLHGWSGHARNWDTVAADLSRDFRLVALDQRGHGESQWAPSLADYSTENRVDDVLRLLNALDIQRCIAVGHSSGGGHPAYILGAEHADRLLGIVIVDVGVEALSPTAVDAARDVEGPFIGRTNRSFESPGALFDLARIRREFRRFSDDELHRWLDNNTMLLESGRFTMRFDVTLRGPQGYVVPRGSAEYLREAVRRIPVPTLLIRGEESYTFESAHASRVADAIPECSLVEIPAAAHWPHAENPAAFIAALRAFFRRYE